MTIKTKVIGYCRVSSQMQVDQGESLERQADQIANYCKLKALPPPEIISDEGLSGYKSNRPGYLKVVELCKAGTVSNLIVYDLSRLSRSVRTTLEFIEDVINKHDINFISLKQSIDTSSPTGKAFLAISAVFNQLYRDEISQKTKDALAHKKANNEKGAGYVPYGYRVVNKKLVENPAEQSVIAKMIEFRNLGYSYPEIIKRLAELGIPTKTSKSTWTASTIRKILSRPDLQLKFKESA